MFEIKPYIYKFSLIWWWTKLKRVYNKNAICLEVCINSFIFLCATTTTTAATTTTTSSTAPTIALTASTIKTTTSVTAISTPCLNNHDQLSLALKRRFTRGSNLFVNYHYHSMFIILQNIFLNVWVASVCLAMILCLDMLTFVFPEFRFLSSLFRLSLL